MPATALVRAAPPPAPSAAPAFSPLYQQIKALITRSLQAGEWKPGEAIPSEMDLAARFKVSQGTVRKAIDELAADNLLVRRQGKGTFVATHAEQQIQYRFLRLMPDDGDARGMAAPLPRLPAPARAGRRGARARPARPATPWCSCAGCCCSTSSPVVLDDIWLPGALFKGLTAERLADYRGPMYGLFETEFGVRMIRAEEKIRAVAADADERRLLARAAGRAAAERGAAVVHLWRQAGGVAPRPVQHRRAPLPQRAELRAAAHAVLQPGGCKSSSVSLLRCNKLRRGFTRVTTRHRYRHGRHATPARPAARSRNIRLVDALQYRLPPAGIVSILHRVSGVLMFLLLPFIIWMFDTSLTSEISLRRASPAPSSVGVGFVPGWFVKLVALALIWAYLHHFIAGVRHLWMDATHSVSKEQGRSSAMVTLVISMLLTLALGAKLFGLF